MEIKHLTSATEAILSDINNLLKQLRHDPSTFEPCSLEALKETLKNPYAAVVAAHENGHIVGTGTLLAVPTLSGNAGEIDDVVVDESQRGKGLGEAIMKKLIEVARERGIKVIQLSSRPSRVAANKLYQKLGFEPKETNVYRMKL